MPSGHPEEGEGVRYNYRQRRARTPGEHPVILELPEDDVVVERRVVVGEGENRPAVEPVYNQRHSLKKVLE